MSNSFCLVMAGGKGTRFWPESTSQRPKQYLSLLDDKETLLSKTLKRFDGLVPKDQRFIVTVKEQGVLAHKFSQQEIGEKGIIFEPAGRNTAPCILLGLISLLENGASENDLVAIVPSDHVILNENGFRETLSNAMELAQKEKSIVTIGIRPNFPHTGYGYIKRGNQILNGHKVSEFKEKPNFETAKEYLKTGEYYWNAGMFVAPIKVLMDEFEACAPEIFSFGEKLKMAIGNENKLEEVYSSMPEDSIDFAVMEKSKNVCVLEALFDWNDLGSWEAMEAVIEPTENNTLIKTKDHYIYESKGNIVYAPDKFVSLVNINDLIIVVNEKVLMVLPKEDGQKVKEVVNFIKNTKKPDLQQLL